MTSTRALVVLLIVAGAALAYRQYRFAQAPDPAQREDLQQAE